MSLRGYFEDDDLQNEVDAEHGDALPQRVACHIRQMRESLLEQHRVSIERHKSLHANFVDTYETLQRSHVATLNSLKRAREECDTERTKRRTSEEREAKLRDTIHDLVEKSRALEVELDKSAIEGKMKEIETQKLKKELRTQREEAAMGLKSMKEKLDQQLYG